MRGLLRVKGNGNHAGGPSRAGRLLGGVAALALAQAVACGGDDDYTIDEDLPPPTGGVEVTVAFPSDTDLTGTAAVRLWVLTPDEGGSATCAQLIGGAVAPDDAIVTQRADVTTTDPTVILADAVVAEGAALVYVEAVDFRGEVVLAGCAEAGVADGETTAVDLTLEPARVYDCSDADTEDGAPCDDGVFCTVGETCQNGSCGGSEARDCSHLEFTCHEAVCDEELGCHAVLTPNVPCDDGRFCTVDDMCNDEGVCHGPARDCDTATDQCFVGGSCSDSLRACSAGSFVGEGAPCDDGDPCTEDSSCDVNGLCTGGSMMDCSDLDLDACNIGTYIDPGVCVTDFAPVGTMCDDHDACTPEDACDGVGACVSVPTSDPNCDPLIDVCEIVTVDPCTGPCHSGVCDSELGCEPRVAGSLCDLLTDCLQTCDADGLCSTAQALPGTMCDDTNECTITDTCDADGTCSGRPVPDQPPTPCQDGIGTCVGGACVIPGGF